MLGGGLGAGLRFLAATFVARLFGGIFPLGTVLINITGSFVIGVLMSFLLVRPDLNSLWRLFLVTGVLGGYTTFSSFEWETLVLVRSGSTSTALANVVVSVAIGYLGVWLGSLMVRR